jgi:hypothetical protein
MLMLITGIILGMILLFFVIALLSVGEDDLCPHCGRDIFSHPEEV